MLDLPVRQLMLCISIATSCLIIGYDKVGRTPSYTRFFSHPTLPIYHKLLRPTCTGLFSHPIPYPIIHPTTSLFIHPTTTFFVLMGYDLPYRTQILYHNLLRLTLDCSAILPCRTSYILPRPLIGPHPTTNFFVHWIVQPSSLIVPCNTSYQVLEQSSMNNPV